MEDWIIRVDWHESSLASVPPATAGGPALRSVHHNSSREGDQRPTTDRPTRQETNFGPNTRDRKDEGPDEFSRLPHSGLRSLLPLGLAYHVSGERAGARRHQRTK